MIGLAALAVFAAVVAVVETGRAHRLSHQASQRAQAAAVAASLGRALFTYSYTDPQAAQDRIQALATPAFGQREAASAASVEANIRSTRATGSATLVRVFVTDVTGSTAGAAVDLDTTTTSTAGSAHVTRMLRVELQRIAGHWKVDGVQVFSAAG